jgi:hypothetical protein
MKKYIGWTKKEWIRILQHAPIGIIASLLTLVHEYGIFIGLAFILCFLSYQFVQEYNNRSRSHVDIAGAIAGLPLGGLFLWLIQ